MTKYLLYTFLFSILCCSPHASAQQQHLSFDHITEQTGLPESQVRDILQDNLGYMWMATQNGLVRYDGYKLKNYKAGEGIKGSVYYFGVANMLKDKQQNLWICSYHNGIFRYDRKTDKLKQATNFQYTNNGNIVFSIMDGASNIWSILLNHGSANAVQKFDHENEKFSRYYLTPSGKNDINGEKIFSIQVSRNGTMMIGTDNGFYIYDKYKNNFRGYLTNADTAKQDTVFGICEEKVHPGSFWVTICNKNDKINRLVHLNIYTNSTKIYSFKKNVISEAHQDKKGRLWIGKKDGLYLYDPRSDNFINYTIQNKTKVKSEVNFINKIIEDKGGNLWLLGDGITKFDPPTKIFQRYQHQKDVATSLNKNIINKLMFDNAGNLWAALRFGGVDYVDKEESTFSILNSERDSLPWHDIRTVMVMPDHNWFIGATNGLFTYNKVNHVVATIKTKFTKFSKLRSLFRLKNGDTYIVSDDGLEIYHPGLQRSEHYAFDVKDSTSLSNNELRSVVEDGKGLVWIGTWGGGVCQFNPQTKKFKRYPFVLNDGNTIIKDKLDDDQVESMYMDHLGVLWVGTNNGGLNHLDRKRDVFVSSFRPSEGVTCINAIKEDTHHKLWAATYLNGLFQVDNYTGRPVKSITENDGLLDNSIINLLSTNNNDFWAITRRGIAKINTVNFTIKNYSSLGTDWQDIVNQLFKYSTIDDNGNIIAWNEDNILNIDTKQLTKDFNAPAVHIETVAYSDSKAVTDSNITLQRFGRKQIDLPYDQNKVTFNYVGIHYQNPQQNIYAYKLKGFDKQWVQAGKARAVTFNNLTPGSYTFIVRSANSDGVWNYKGDSIIIVIHPPWWNTWWMWFVYAVLFVLAVYAIIKYRSRKLERENSLLEEKVNLRTHQLSEANKDLNEKQEEIIAQRDQLSEANENLSEQQQQILSQKKRSDDLLLNILPADVAEELKQKGTANARLFDEVSVLFTDFVNFTAVGEKLSPQELVDELHYCFKSFDDIITKHNIEKIKTIGDAYLAVAGLPNADANHAFNAVNAAFEITQFITARKEQLGDRTFDIRVGIHSGSVVAGIVGVKKFAYDIWGDTVNTAARMEQNSEPGKINVSEKTHELIKDKFASTYRGEIEAKNKGKLKMYFVNI